MKWAVVLCNLGGPTESAEIRPFLRAMFSDPAIIRAPGFVRYPLAWFIAHRRGPVSEQIYKKIGGFSPLLTHTKSQAYALECELQKSLRIKVFIAMRYATTRASFTIKNVKEFNPDGIILLPLYPQYSTTTTASSFKEWRTLMKKEGMRMPLLTIRSYPDESGFISALSARILAAKKNIRPDLSYRFLFSAHGLPERIIAAGDPYAQEVDKTATALADALELKEEDYVVCYQSHLGPLKWIGPSIAEELDRAAADKVGVIVVPVAFVSEHSETLVELDMEYADYAARVGVPHYLRAATVCDHDSFIAGLASLVRRKIKAAGVI